MTRQGFRQFILAGAAAAALLTTTTIASASLVGADGQPAATPVATEQRTAQVQPAVYRDREKVAVETPAVAPEQAAPTKDPEAAKPAAAKPDADDGAPRKAQRRHHRRDFGRVFVHKLRHFGWRIGLRW
jgi:hypothetical protein